MEKARETKGVTDSPDDIDARTVFVRSLPFTLTDSQFQDIFSEVGPVRHCFTVKEKGSDQHRGFGFVQFAVTEDARRAVQEKSGALLQGRKIKVEIAKRRAPLDVRHPKSDLSRSDVTTFDEELPLKCASDIKKRKSTDVQTGPSLDNVNREHLRSTKKLRSGVELQSVQTKTDTNEEQKETKKKEEPGVELQEVRLEETSAGVKKRHKKIKKSDDKLQVETGADKRKEYEEPQASSKQRPARTVVVGGLASTEMVEAVLEEVKKAGPIEAIQRTFTELELSSRGLAKDGCKPRAVAIVFLSVRAARSAVAALHNKPMMGGVIWARQLGGEGSKLKQLRLIVRNLPFQITEATLRELFSPAGFVWEVTIPRKSDGLSRGFAFIGFTSKVDAEKAIEIVNGKLVGKRPVAVDWAVAKKQYEAAVNPASSVITPDADLDESESTASESEADGDSFGRDEHVSDDPDRSRMAPSLVERQVNSKDEISAQNNTQMLVEDEEKVDVKSEELDHCDEDKKASHPEKMDIAEEMDMVKKILNKVVTSVHDQGLGADEDIAEALASKHSSEEQLKSCVVQEQLPKIGIADGRRANPSSKVENAGVVVESEKDGDDSKLSRTVFIRNLPGEAKVPELRKLFSEFGKIRSLRLVLNPITKRSKGNAFLEYVMQEAAQAAVKAAAKSGADDLGLMLKGRALTVSMAVDKDSARKMAKETFHKQVEEDRRNLALAKEGQVLVGAPAAEGVSKKDMLKRQQLEHEKATKLRSPNFHVSRTRLSVHNIPKSMSEKEIKKLFIEAVKSRASKQKPVIKQVKLLVDEGSQRSRGAAFVEFTEHQHALVALRVLNNNPDTFGIDCRPIVEFAIENSLILRKRAANMAKNWTKGAQDMRSNQGGVVVEKVGGTKRQKRHGDKGLITIEERSLENERHQNEKTDSKADHKRKSWKDKDGNRKLSKRPKLGGPETATKASPDGGLRNDGEKQEPKTGHKIKRGKISGTDRKAAQARRGSVGLTERVLATNGKDQQSRNNIQQISNKGINQRKDKVPVSVEHVKKPKPSKRGFLHKAGGSNGRTQVEIKRRRNHAKGEPEDKLDKLVAEYRTKYFSDANKATASKGMSGASRELQRWFE